MGEKSQKDFSDRCSFKYLISMSLLLLQDSFARKKCGRREALSFLSLSFQPKSLSRRENDAESLNHMYDVKVSSPLYENVVAKMITLKASTSVERFCFNNKQSN